MEELQSDRHQMGREQGYAAPIPQNQLDLHFAGQNSPYWAAKDGNLNHYVVYHNNRPLDNIYAASEEAARQQMAGKHSLCQQRHATRPYLAPINGPWRFSNERCATP